MSGFHESLRFHGSSRENSTLYFPTSSRVFAPDSFLSLSLSFLILPRRKRFSFNRSVRKTMGGMGEWKKVYSSNRDRNGSSPRVPFREMKDSPDPEEFPRHKFVVDSGNGSISRRREEGFGIFPRFSGGLNLGPGCRIFQLNPPCKLALAWAPRKHRAGASSADIHRPTEISFCLAPSVARDVHTNTPTRRGMVHTYTHVYTRCLDVYVSRGW